MPDLDFIATLTSLVVSRSPKFNPGALPQSLLSSVATGMASLHLIVGYPKDRVPVPILCESLHERFDIRFVSFLSAVLSDFMVQHFKPASEVLKPTVIRRIVLQDASGQVIPKSNA